MTDRTAKTLIIACGMIAREVEAVRAQLGLNHLKLTCLPADFHHHPERIAPAADIAVREAKAAGYNHIFIGYADCGTGGDLDKVCADHGVERLPGPHCFAFYQGMAAFDALGDRDMRSFYMTDFLARQFDAFLVRPLGLDRHPELRDAYFSHYKTLVYLAQTNDPTLTAAAQDAAHFLGLGFERRLTGYGDLTLALAALSQQQGT